MAFYKPDPNSQQVYDERGTPLSYEQYKAAGGTGVAGQGAFADVQAGPWPTAFAPLPNVQAGAPQAPQASPVDKFNQGILELLTSAQGAANNPTLLNERNRLGVQQISNSMAPASKLGIDNLDPNAALSARQNAGRLYNPEINNLTDRIQASAQAVSQFENAIETARSFGEQYAKSVQVDDATIQAVKDQMRAGFVPSASVIEKLGKYLTAEDWNALSAAKATTGGSGSDKDIEQYNLAKSEGFQGTFQQWVDRPSQYKSGGGGGTPSTATERAQAKQGDILATAGAILEQEKSTSGDHWANPDTYRKFKSQYISAGGTAAEFLATYSPAVYIAPANRVGDLSVSSGRSA